MFGNREIFIEKSKQGVGILTVTILIVMIVSCQGIFLGCLLIPRITLLLQISFTGLNVLFGALLAYVGYSDLLRRQITIFERLNWKKLLVSVGAFLLVLLGTYVLHHFFGKQVETSDNQEILDEMLGRVSQGLPLFFVQVSMIIIGPIVEEIYFRGILFYESRMFGTIFQAIWPTIIFALVHGPANLYQ
ncbi:CPBP family glutamic-type intramembrane protease [Leuconostoc citreum]